MSAALESGIAPAVTDTQRRVALAHAEMGSWYWDLAAHHYSLDARWCALMDIDPCAGPDHLERWARNIHPDDVFEFQRRLEELRSGRSERFECEYRVLTAGSRSLWLLQRGHVLEHDEAGRPVRICGVCIEIDVRKQAEVAVQENEARLATALWGARAAFWQWQIAAGAVVMSPLWFAMTGYTREQWEGAADPWFSRIHPEDRERVEHLMQAHLAGASLAIDAEYRIRTGNGRWKWMLTRGRAVAWDFDGKPTMAIGISLDIHARKDAEPPGASTVELARLEREIIEIANREQQRIGSDLHDGLGQDLTGIALMLRGVAAQLDDATPALQGEVEEVISLVNNAIESTRTLARGLSPVSAERGGLAVALAALAERTGERYGLQVSFSCESHSAVARLDDSSATHVYRIAQEALTNVVRHSLATEATVHLASAGAGLQLRIEDNGRGFAQHLAAVSGGLGLRIMRYRAQMMGGELVLESSGDGGTVVRCAFPLP